MKRCNIPREMSRYFWCVTYKIGMSWSCKITDFRYILHQNCIIFAWNCYRCCIDALWCNLIVDVAYNRVDLTKSDFYLQAKSEGCNTPKIFFQISVCISSTKKMTFSWVLCTRLKKEEKSKLKIFEARPKSVVPYFQRLLHEILTI